MQKHDARRKAAQHRLERSLDPDKHWRRLERRCFWTWPWGHIWKRGETGALRSCLSCGRTETEEFLDYGGSDWIRQRRDMVTPATARERYALGLMSLDELESVPVE
jgi:hypothetical protein